mgnify:CR=1 FL=1
MIFALNFFIRRLAQGVVIVVLVALLVFTLLRVVPGDPVDRKSTRLNSSH